MTKDILQKFIDEISDKVSEKTTERLFEKIMPLLPTKEEKAFITRQEAANILRVSLPTLRAWTVAGRLKSYRINSRIRYRKSEVEKAVMEIPYRKG